VQGMESGLIDPLVDPRRLVQLEAVHNFRDLGGYPARNGTITRWHQLYRADGLYRLSAADIEIVRDLGLRTVVDLRSDAEVEKWGTFPRSEIEVTFARHAVIDQTWDHEGHEDRTEHEFLVWAYQEMLAVGSARFAQAIESLAQPGALPAVFHCAAGKDRTGLLAALLLESLGVPRAVVLADYELTVQGMQRMRTWMSINHPEMVEAMANVPPAFMAALPGALGEVLDGVAGAHGSVANYVRFIGVSAEAIEALADQLLVTP
jgi:protein-tyrosine phosphatase